MGTYWHFQVKSLDEQRKRKMSSLFDHNTFLPRNFLDGLREGVGTPCPPSRGYENVIRCKFVRVFTEQLTCAETKMWEATIRKETRTRFRLRRRQSSSWVTPMVTSAMTRMRQPKRKIDHIMEKRVKFALRKSFTSAAKILIIEVSEWHLNPFHLLLLCCWYALVVDDYDNAVVVSVVLLTLLLLLVSDDDDDDDGIVVNEILYCLISQRSI